MGVDLGKNEGGTGGSSPCALAKPSGGAFLPNDPQPRPAFVNGSLTGAPQVFMLRRSQLLAQTDVTFSPQAGLLTIGGKQTRP